MYIYIHICVQIRLIIRIWSKKYIYIYLYIYIIRILIWCVLVVYTNSCFTPMMNYGKFMKIPYRMGDQWYIKAYYDEIVPIKRCWQHCLHIEVAQLILVVTTTVNTLELGGNDLAFVLSQCGYTIQYNGMYIIYQHWDNGW